jgi:tetratricopeptide (TPR) repeat protein
MKGVEAFLGMSEARSANIRAAVPLLEKGFLNPISDEWRLEAGVLLVDAYQRLDDRAKMQQTLAALERAYPANTEVLYLAYRVYAAHAARAVTALVKAAPDSARLHQIAGEMIEGDGDYPAAVTQYRKALEKEPRLPGGHRALGVALMNKSTDEASRREAEHHFRAELELNPNDAAAEYQLGEMMWLGNQPKEALGHFNRALELQENFPDALIAAGKAYSALKQPAQAVRLLEKAVALDPQHDVARYRLAQALKALGNQDRAEREFIEFRRLRSAQESLRTLYRQIQENRITSQTLDEPGSR